MSSPGEHCAVCGCSAALASGYLLCWAHWADVEKQFRDNAWNARKARQEYRGADPVKVAKLDRAVELAGRDALAALGVPTQHPIRVMP